MIAPRTMGAPLGVDLCPNRALRHPIQERLGVCYAIKGVEPATGRTAFRSLATSTFTEQKRFKTVLAEQGLARQTINNIISTGRAAVRMAWQKGEMILSVAPFTLLRLASRNPWGRCEP